MGVPKFYRWISERYPNTSRIINDNQIPDFDNFYLDMNGIIHACSHVNDDKCDTNVTEEQIFRNIFHYIDFLFRMIKPKKVFYMAVDGVAPRAKMNQQRSRRFRAGRDRMKKLTALSEKTGKTLKETITDHFDTNCITPGTQFMANLDEQLRYFINVKLSTDPLWDGVEVHLSGHLTPGEGEHKIMEYIRYERSQPNYDINTRHCLYGLDADLIMLGLVTHEMHFALLREEVKYGGKKSSKILTPEEINWHLLQLCLLRDYIDLEFSSIKNTLKFPYDLESIIDDWILMGYLVGNDFIPHLPHVHINREALPLLWETYKIVLPKLDGYMNQSGELNLSRFQTYLTELAKHDYDHFVKEIDSNKQMHTINSSNKRQSELDPVQSLPNKGFSVEILEKLMMSMPTTSIIELNGSHEDDSNGRMIDRFIDSERKLKRQSTSSSDNNDVLPIASPDIDDDDDELVPGAEHLAYGENEKKSSFLRLPSVTMNEKSVHTMSNEYEFRQYKDHYYRDKMRCQSVTKSQLQIYVQQYIEALQWILKYYYQGCPSWSWFYPHHYAPYLSDLTDFKHLTFTFQKGKPFNPFEQLLSVLPPSSRSLLPASLQSLMVSDESPLLDFYPEDFQLDQNEKEQDWEAIVLLPFIDEQLLLNSISRYYPLLSDKEKQRNQHQPSVCFKTTLSKFPTNALLLNNPYFPPLKETRAICKEYSVDYFRPNGLKFIHGRFNEEYMLRFPKFPVLNVMPYTFEFRKGVVNLFESHSKSTTLVLNLTRKPDPDCIILNEKWNPKENDYSQRFQITNRQLLIERYLGKCIFVNWPNFEYGIVCAISDCRNFYVWTNIPGGTYFDIRSLSDDNYCNDKNSFQTPICVSQHPFEVVDENVKTISHKVYVLDSTQASNESTKANAINQRYESRHGAIIGPIPILLYVCPLIGYRTKSSSTSDRCQTAMVFSHQALAYPLQTSLFTIPNYKYDYYRFPQTVDEYLKAGDTVFGLQAPFYSSAGHVKEMTKGTNGECMFECYMEQTDTANQPNIHNFANKLARFELRYWTAQDVAAYLRVKPSIVSKLTGIVHVTSVIGQRETVTRTNVGFSWKANKPLKQLYGYTKKIEKVWYYSDEAVNIISDYMLQFPEIIKELDKKPKDDTYSELNIWPSPKMKSRLKEVRTWIKSLPTYSMQLTDGSWQILDAPVIKEIERMTKLHYDKRPVKTPNEKPKRFMTTANNLFKPCESIGMCDSDLETSYELYDRVVTVRLGTGVPLGTRGTVIGILHGPTYLDTYYEILFDHLPKTSLEAILYGGNNQPCRVKVRSYHLLNYSHSLRIRSMPNYQQRFGPVENVWDKRVELAASPKELLAPFQQPTRILKRGSNENETVLIQKSTPQSTDSQEKQKPIDAQTVPTQIHQFTEQPTILKSTESPRSLLTESKSVIHPQPIISNMSETSLQSSSNTSNNSPIPFLLLRAIQESKQMESSPQQSSVAQSQPVQTQRDSMKSPPFSCGLPHQMNAQPKTTPTQSNLSFNAPTFSVATQPTHNNISTYNQQGWKPIPAVPYPTRIRQAFQSDTPPHQQNQHNVFAEAIANMSQTPPTSLLSRFENQTSTNNTMQTAQQQQQQQQPSSIFDIAIRQSYQQFNTHQALSPNANEFNNLPTFQPFDLMSQNTNAHIPIQSHLNQSPIRTQHHYQQHSPNQSAHIRTASNHPVDVSHASYSSPPSQSQTTLQGSSPRVTTASTLQFVPSQVLRNMPKNHK